MSSLDNNIINYSSFCVDEIKKEKPENFIDNDKYIEIFLEFVYLFLNMTDRIAFSILELEEKTSYIDKLGRNIESILENNIFKNYVPNQKEAFDVLFFQELNSRMLEYYKYKKIIPAEGESPKQTLLWEFSKKISQLIDNSSDIANMMVVNDLIVYSVKGLKLKEAIEKHNF